MKAPIAVWTEAKEILINLPMLKKVIFVLPLLLLISCSVQKRKYQSGFYVSWLGHKSGAEQKANPAGKCPPSKPVVNYALTEKKSAGAEQMKIKTVSHSPKVVAKKAPLSQPADSCDRLIFKNGDEALVHVTLMTNDEVRYNRCGTDGPAYVVRKKDLFMLVQASGSREVFNDESHPASTQPKTNIGGSKPSRELEENDMAVYSLIAGIAGCTVGLGSIPAIIFGTKALREMRENPGKYKGEGMAQAGIALGAIKLGLLLLSLVFLVLLFNL